jgi:ribulose-phosphate 3-epimerase
MTSAQPSPSRPVRIAPSILSADFSRLGEQVAEATMAGADYIHVDVMDGIFVPNLTLGPVVIEGIRKSTHLPLDVHLQIIEPEKLIDDYIGAGADRLIFHAEACQHINRLVHQIKERGLKAGLAINPSTPLSALEEMLPDLDIVLLSSVNPGFSGQKFISSVLRKLTKLRSLVDENGYTAELELDGGMNEITAPLATMAGATVLVAGSAVFNEDEPIANAVSRLRNSIPDTLPQSRP